MIRIRTAIRNFTLIIAAIILVAGYTLPAFADDPPACPAANGTNAPTGADAQAYSFNANTCLWENDYYTWNPVTKVTTAKYSQTYTYNNATGQWDYPIWLWNAAAGTYQQIILSATQPPAGALTIGGPPALSPTTAASVDTSIDPSTDGSGIVTTATVNNNLTSAAGSGDALVLANTTAGSATSGNAVDMATILNILQSTTSLQGGGVTTFTKDIGNYTGDIVLDPSTFSSLNTVENNNLPTDLTINSKVNGQINNNVDLTAGSGNATVLGNTTAGNATTGDTAAIANIVNVINSMIGAGQSFVGTININGALNGDILLPQGTLDSLLASGSSPTQPNDSTFNANITDNSSINNTLNLAAKSGSATVSDNTTAGDATSGKASTNITLLNLTGKQVVGNDALLVFVNVMGKWIGMIVNAPTGSNSAALCSCTSTDSGGAGNTDINAETNSSINNNLNLKATSGNALVNRNTTAGNATSGNALASINLLNISASSLSLSHWLGVLFINVFGSWNGSFGIDTAAGNLPGSGGGSSVSAPSVVKAVKVFTVTPGDNNQSYTVTPAASADNPSSSDTNSNHHPMTLSTISSNPSGGSPSHHPSLLWTAGSLFLLAGVITTEEAIVRRKEARANFRRYLDAITVQPFKRY